MLRQNGYNLADGRAARGAAICPATSVYTCPKAGK